MTAALKWVETLRKSTPMNKKEFCRFCGISYRTYRRWLYEGKSPSRELLQIIGVAFHTIPPKEIVNSAPSRGICEAKESAPIARWAYDGKPRMFCRRKRCEWKSPDGRCHMPGCMKEVAHAHTRKPEKD